MKGFFARLFSRAGTQRETVYHKGLEGEKQAERYLRRQGYRVLHRRYRYPGSEIDLICREGNTVVFVEVKYRPEGVRGDGFSAVTEDKMRRIRRCADDYMGANPVLNARIDLIEITSEGLEHIRNA